MLAAWPAAVQAECRVELRMLQAVILCSEACCAMLLPPQECTGGRGNIIVILFSDPFLLKLECLHAVGLLFALHCTGSRPT